MNGMERALRGECGICGNAVEHGTYTKEQIEELAKDIGITPQEFEDWCDDCFVENITQGDVHEASRLLGGRDLKLRNLETAFKYLLGIR